MALSEKEEYIAQCMATGKTREECEHLWNEAHKTSDQQTKEEWIKQCMAGGKTREECEKAWNEAHSSADYAAVVREKEMLKVKLDQTLKMLREATGIIKAINAEKDAMAQARKYELAMEIERDTDGRLKHEDLMKESPRDLAIMKKAIDSARPKNFYSVSTVFLNEDAERKREPQLTVGEYDPETKKFRGGIKIG